MNGHNSACKCDDCLNGHTPGRLDPPPQATLPRAARRWSLGFVGEWRPLPAGCARVRMCRPLCWSELLSGWVRLRRAGWVEGRDFLVCEHDQANGAQTILIAGAVMGLV